MQAPQRITDLTALEIAINEQGIPTTPEGLLQWARGAGCVLRAMPDGTLGYRAPAGMMTDELIATLREHKPALLALLAQEQDDAVHVPDGEVPASAAQPTKRTRAAKKRATEAAPSPAHPSADQKAIIVRQLETMPVGQRTKDGYVNATAMCQVVGKEWSHYRTNKDTNAFLDELSGSLGIPRDLLTHSITRGPNHERGTWVHPLVAINLAQWCSPKFAVQVSRWVAEWYTTGENPMHKLHVMSFYNNQQLQKAMSAAYHAYLSRTNGNYVHVNAELCKTHSDWHWYPSQYKDWAKTQCWPSKDRSSGLAVLRVKEPPSVAAITTEKWAVMCGAKPVAARQIANKFKEGFQLCLAAGIASAEMHGDQDVIDVEPS